MPSNTTEHDESGDGVPRWVATARRESRARRLVTRTGRLFRARQRTRPGLYPSTDRGTQLALSRRVLRDYHATNLATARAGSEELVRAGFNTGDVPYGYRADRVRVTPPGRRPRWRTRLVIEPVEAATVRMIFAWRGEDRVPVREIRRRLAAARYPAPLDPVTGQPGVWTVPTIRAVLRNPKYLGRQVWGRRHRGRRTHPDRWVWSPEWAHPPIVSAELFAAATPRLRTAAR